MNILEVAKLFKGSQLVWVMPSRFNQGMYDFCVLQLVSAVVGDKPLVDVRFVQNTVSHKHPLKWEFALSLFKERLTGVVVRHVAVDVIIPSNPNTDTIKYDPTPYSDKQVRTQFSYFHAHKSKTKGKQPSEIQQLLKQISPRV